MDSTDNLYFINSGGSAIENDASRNILMKELNRMIDSFRDSIKIPFIMHYMKDTSIREIADLFKLPLGTVKSRIFFARKTKGNDQRDYGDYSLVRLDFL